jgi:DedD protein
MPRHDTDAPDDGQIELKKRARRRLVGAAALALAAIIVLPIVMDREPRQPAQDIQVKIPSQDSSVASRILSTRPSATPLPQPDQVRPAEGKAPAVDAAKEAPKPSSEDKPQPKPADKAPDKAPDKASEKPADKAPEKAAKPAEKPADKTAEKPAQKPAADKAKAEEARAQAALKGAEVGGQWVVQLGAYKEEGRVKILVAKLKEMSVPTFTEAVETPQGSRTRVRAGPFKSREAAEQAQAKARRIGVDGTVAQQNK